jgi:hypothetical protein
MHNGVNDMVSATSGFEFALRNWLVLINMLIKHVRVGFLGTGLADSGTSTLLTEMSAGIKASHIAVAHLRSNVAYVALLGVQDYEFGLEAYQSLRANLTDPTALESAVLGKDDGHRLEVWHRAWRTVEQQLSTATTVSSSKVYINQTVEALSRSALLRASFSLALHQLAVESRTMKSLLDTASNQALGAVFSMHDMVGNIVNLYAQVVRVIERGVHVIGAAVAAVVAMLVAETAESQWYTLVKQMLMQNQDFAVLLTRFNYSIDRLDSQYSSFEGLIANATSLLAATEVAATDLSTDLSAAASEAKEALAAVLIQKVQTTVRALEEVVEMVDSKRTTYTDMYAEATALEKVYVHVIDTVYQHNNFLKFGISFSPSSLLPELCPESPPSGTSAPTSSNSAWLEPEKVHLVEALDSLGVTFGQAQQRVLVKAEGLVLPSLQIDVDGTPQELTSRSEQFVGVDRVAGTIAGVVRELDGVARSLDMALALIRGVRVQLKANTTTAALLELLLPSDASSLVVRVQNVTSGLAHWAGRHKSKYVDAWFASRLMNHVWWQTYNSVGPLEEGSSFASVATKVVDKASELIQWSSALGSKMLFALEVPSAVLNTVRAKLEAKLYTDTSSSSSSSTSATTTTTASSVANTKEIIVDKWVKIVAAAGAVVCVI